MSDRPICEICGRPLGEHHLTMRHGVAYAAVFGPDGRERPCGSLEGDAQYTCGRAAELESVARGLKNLAGRLRNRGYPSAAAALANYAERKAGEARRAWAQAKRTRVLWKGGQQ